MRAPLLFAFMVCLSATARAQSMDRYVLPNGLEVVLARTGRDDVTVAVRYDAGMASDPAGYGEFAHLTEHLAFGATRNLPSGKRLDLLERVGAGYNAYTAFEDTVFLAALTRETLPLGLYVESERMAFGIDAVTEQSLAHEQRVVTNEFDQRRTLGRMLREAQMRALYGEGHPFVTTGHERDDIQAATVDGLRGYFQRVYRPDDATLFVVGDFDVESTRALITEYFGPIVSPAVPKAKRPAPAPKVCGPHRLSLGLPTLVGSSLHFTWVIPERVDDAEHARLALLVSAMDRALEETLVQSHSLVSSSSFALTEFRSHSLVELELDLFDNTKFEPLERAVLTLVARYAQGDIPGEALAFAREQRRAHATMYGGSVGGTLALLIEGRDPERALGVPEDTDAAIASRARFLSTPPLIVRVEPRPHAGQPTVLDDEGGCP